MIKSTNCRFTIIVLRTRLPTVHCIRIIIISKLVRVYTVIVCLSHGSYFGATDVYELQNIQTFLINQNQIIRVRRNIFVQK